MAENAPKLTTNNFRATTAAVLVALNVATTNLEKAVAATPPIGTEQKSFKSEKQERREQEKKQLIEKIIKNIEKGKIILQEHFKLIEDAEKLLKKMKDLQNTLDPKSSERTELDASILELETELTKATKRRIEFQQKLREQELLLQKLQNMK